MPTKLVLSGVSVLSALLTLTTVGTLSAQQQPQTPPAPMTFFITSRGVGNGANLGGLAGADKHCQTLAAAAGAGGRTWRAYLSQSRDGQAPAIHARDRIGSGPWHNAKGQLIASDVADLHEDRNNIRKPSALTEKGAVVTGVGDTANQHDMLTGSDSMGRAVPGNMTHTTCSNWTSNGMGGAIVGHHDRLGGGIASWNSVHTTNGCSQENLLPQGGVGLFYCFAAN